MTTLREALDDIAAEAPAVDLTHLVDAAVTGRRRRRRRRTGWALTAVATVTVMGAVTAAVVVPGQRGGEAATQRRAEPVLDLPDSRVGKLSSAYMTPCAFDAVRKKFDCGMVEWRVVTSAGTTYRVPEALAMTENERRAPVAVSRDGRMLAYYSREAQAHVVRDLVTGSETTSPVTVEEERIDVGSMLAVSDDGRHLVFDPREGSKKPGLLIDVRTGKTVSVPGTYEVVTIKDGVAELVRYRKTDLWLMPVTGGGKPVRFDGAFIGFSELAPDGRTVAAYYFPPAEKGRFPKSDLVKRGLSLLDTKTGRALRKVDIRGLPKDGGIFETSLWLNEKEVTLAFQSTKGQISTYAVDTTTGQARLLTRHPGGRNSVVLPGAAAG
ncbi:hypothetical protein [Nonomuraea diastatica]|uniref:WD40 repeat domain-containing protein n=1 Tax=Nonomuraea diastatica TaxID=1848329 RepID=A0A4R4X0Q6_9ACTN|nr:hypothetical protein [Nonomuraea diastatica]TDD23682.1 hypothetical protein E1294_08120 [Nonomuraea diastatica]